GLGAAAAGRADPDGAAPPPRPPAGRRIATRRRRRRLGDLRAVARHPGRLSVGGGARRPRAVGRGVSRLDRAEAPAGAVARTVARRGPERGSPGSAAPPRP